MRLEYLFQREPKIVDRSGEPLGWKVHRRRIFAVGERRVRPTAAVFGQQCCVETESAPGKATLDRALAGRPSPGVSDPEAANGEDAKEDSQKGCQQKCELEESVSHPWTF